LLYEGTRAKVSARIEGERIRTAEGAEPPDGFTPRRRPNTAPEGKVRVPEVKKYVQRRGMTVPLVEYVDPRAKPKVKGAGRLEQDLASYTTRTREARERKKQEVTPRHRKKKVVLDSTATSAPIKIDPEAAELEIIRKQAAEATNTMQSDNTSEELSRGQQQDLKEQEQRKLLMETWQRRGIDFQLMQSGNPEQMKQAVSTVADMMANSLINNDLDQYGELQDLCMDFGMPTRSLKKAIADAKIIAAARDTGKPA
jgi:hypothetical protein